MEKPSFLIFFKDWPLNPEGINGGAENATINLAKELAQLNFRTIVCAELPDGECIIGGVEYWNLGQDYNSLRLIKRARTIGPYHLISASIVHPIMDAREESSCLSRVIINHDPTNYSAGLKFNIVTRLVDKLLCVSEAQRSIVVGHGGEISKTLVMKNGVDTNLFLYGNPDKRDYMNLVYAGVLIFEKGIHVLINSFGQLKQEFPNLKLDIYGRDGGWKVIDNQKDQIESSMPGLKFHGAVSQATLAKAFQNAGACVVPSISFDSCPLVCLDALASGCPVVGFNIGGIPELITHNSTGIIVDSPTPEALTANLSQLLKNPDSLKQMSVNCESLCRNRTWATYTKELVALCENIAHSKSSQTNIVQNDSIGSDVLQKVALNLKNSIEGQGHFAHQLK